MKTRRALATLALAFVLFFPGLALHEGLHLAVLHLVGGQGSIIERPWRFDLLPVTWPSVHVQPVPALDFNRQLTVNFFGPAMAAVVFAAAALVVRRPEIRLALAANAAALLFFALIESASLIAESNGMAPGAIEAEEFNYGVPLVLFLLTALVAVWPSRRASRPPR